MPWLSILLSLFLVSAAEKTPVFRFHLLAEPHSLDPQSTSASSGNYLFHNIFRGLYYYSGGKLRPEGAEKCIHSKLKVRCTLKQMQWSDGTTVTAQQYVRAFRRVVDPEQKSPQADILFPLKNARAILKGDLKPDQLGVEAADARTLIFNFAEEDPEFEYRLVHPALTPLPDGGYLKREEGAKLPTNGPYKISEWKIGAWVKLLPNPNYVGGHPDRPPAEALFIEDDSTALRLYESGALTFLRRLVGSEVPRFKDSPEFRQIPMARFDYVGFGPQLKAFSEVRESLIKGVEYKDFMRLFSTISPPGCPSLPKSYLDKVKCFEFNPVAAKSLAKTARKSLPKLEMQFSRMGGDDIARAVEWFQGQWKKNSGLTVEIQGQEQLVYLQTLRSNPPAIFRKGVNLDRPTCTAALENFVKGHRENYVGVDDSKFEKGLKRLAQTSEEGRRKRLCRELVDRLMSLNLFIPLGEMYFTILAKRDYAGWDLNELNQLDLSQLHPVR